VNGKEVRVLEYSVTNPDEVGEWNDPEVDADDLKALTDIEQEAFGEDLTAYLQLPVGESEEVPDYPTCFACGEEEDADGRCKCTNADSK